MNKTIIRELVNTGIWSEQAAHLCERAGHRCEYCGLDFFASADNYKQWQEDHIIPQCLGGDNSIDNLAASCRTCNVDLKSRWDPREVAGATASREQLVAAVRQYVSHKRTTILSDVIRFRIICDCS